ncbi:MAG: response regulator [bacterium]|nr:response regulator [bacterium]
MNKVVDPVLYVVDDDYAICEALIFLFSTVHISVKTYSSAELFLQEAKDMRGCILIDVQLPGISGLQLLEQLNKDKISMPVIMMTGLHDIGIALKAMKAGAIDFVIKPFSMQSLVENVQKIISKMNDPLIQNLSSFNKRFNTLTEREQQILALIYEGALNKQISQQLSISVSTVEAHRAKIMKKMEAKNLAELIKINFMRQLDVNMLAY